LQTLDHELVRNAEKKNNIILCFTLKMENSNFGSTANVEKGLNFPEQKYNLKIRN